MTKKIYKKIKKSWKLIWLISIWILVILGFVIIAGFLVFRASGYAYNFKTGRIQKTGLIYVRTYPASADIYLDKEFIGSRTPLRISYLLPDWYHLEIKKDGYKKIEKNLRVYEGLVTGINNILLFFENPKSKKINLENILDFLPQEKDKVFLLYEKEGLNLGIYNFVKNRISNSQKIENLGSIPVIIESINKNYLILKIENNQYLIWNWKTNKYLNLAEKLEISQVDKIKIYKNKIIALSSGDLYFYNPSKNEGRKIFQDIIDFSISSQIFAIQKDSSKNQLIQINSDNFRKRIINSNLEINDPIGIAASNDSQFAILDDKYQLYIAASKKITLIAKNVQDFNWTKDRSWLDFGEKLRLVYYTDNEIWLYQKNHKDIFNKLKEKYLLRRLSHHLDKVNFFYNENNIYYLCNDEIAVTDTWGTATQIQKLNKGEKFKFSEDFKNLLILRNNNLEILKIR